MLLIPFRPRLCAALCTLVLGALAFTVSSPAFAADSDLNELREQLRLLKEQYEKRISALEQRLQQAEQTSAQAKQTATTSQAAAQASSQPSGQRGASSSQSAFNPAISLILNGTYGNLSRDPSSYRIDGFLPSGGEVAPPSRNFSLGESELAISANIDPYFRGALNAALTADNEVEVEEANIQTLGLSNGFTIKAGRFLSAIGYQNEIHAHAWDFADASLASKAFLGGKFADDGVQVKWIAPTDLYFDVGVELGRGRVFPGGPEGGRNKNGFGASNLFAHLGGDIGASTSWKLGLSYLRARAEDRAYTDSDSTGVEVNNSFAGTSRLWTLGGVLKWAPNGNATVTNFKLQGEYFRRRETGSLTYDVDAASLGTQSGAYASRQSGWYLQGVYQFMPRWRAGYRYDRLNAGSTGIGLVDSGALTVADFPILSAYNPVRNTVMVDWSGSEFSRLRLQLARERSRFGETDNQILLQYIMSLGAHGAHQF